MNHDEKVARIAAEVAERARRRAEGPVSLRKSSVSHMVPTPGAPAPEARRIDLSDLDEVLEIDPAGRTATVEPGVTFTDLVKATLPHGLLPTLVPELKTITVGGAIAGCSVESMSFRYGGLHDGALEYEVVTGTGERLDCSREENADVFEMIHGSYGTLGILTQARLRLVPARPYVHLEYRHFSRFADFRSALLETSRAPGDVDFIDGIVHAKDHLVLCLGRFVDEMPIPSAGSDLEPYYESTRRLYADIMPTYDYLFRYDADCHWLTRTVPGLSSGLGRRLLGPILLGSTNLLTWSRRLGPVLRLQRHRPVIVDVFIPARRFEEFFEWYGAEIDFYPLWVVPYRTTALYPWIAPAYARKIGDDLFIDCAIYGKPNGANGVDLYKVIEDEVFRLNGLKALISENRYDRHTFWTIYDRARYEAVKRRTDPAGLFRDLYDKLHPGQDARLRRSA